MLVVASSPALWYVARGSGLVLMALLTVVVCLGVLEVTDWSPPGWPRFVLHGVHRNLALLAVALLAVHVLSAELDPFAPLGWLALVVPFASSYRPLWLGLGTLSLDMVAAVVVSSLIRTRLGYRSWRAVHWLAYVAWPVALAHCLGTGTDSAIPWVLLLDGACLLAVVVVSVVRLLRLGPERVRARRFGLAAVALATSSLIALTVLGPLQPGWASRAGTPAKLLAVPVGAAGRAGSQPWSGAL